MTVKYRVSVLMIAGILAVASPVHADAATTATASATGAQATGALAVSPTPTVTATQPPDSRLQRDATIDQSAGTVRVKATSTVVAEAARESRLATPVFQELADNARRRHFRVDSNNARAFSETRGLAVTLASLGETPVVEAASVQASAVARCQDNQAFFDTAFKVTGLKVLGRETPGDTIDLPVGAGSDPALRISVKRGEAGRLPSGGVFMNGLHITVPGLGLDLVLARSEAKLPTPCGTEKNSGGVPSRLGTPVAQKRTITPSTGGPAFLLPAGGGMAALAGVLYIVTRRARPRAADPGQR